MSRQAAFTSLDQIYPAFINARTEDGQVVVYIRGASPDGNRCGPEVQIVMSQADFALWLARASAMVGE